MRRFEILKFRTKRSGCDRVYLRSKQSVTGLNLKFYIERYAKFHDSPRGKDALAQPCGVAL